MNERVARRGRRRRDDYFLKQRSISVKVEVLFFCFLTYLTVGL